MGVCCDFFDDYNYNMVPNQNAINLGGRRKLRVQDSIIKSLPRKQHADNTARVLITAARVRARARVRSARGFLFIGMRQEFVVLDH